MQGGAYVPCGGHGQPGHKAVQESKYSTLSVHMTTMQPQSGVRYETDLGKTADLHLTRVQTIMTYLDRGSQLKNEGCGRQACTKDKQSEIDVLEADL